MGFAFLVFVDWFIVLIIGIAKGCSRQLSTYSIRLLPLSIRNRLKT